MWGLFCESMTPVVGIGIGIAPNRDAAGLLAAACGIQIDAEFWFLFGDLERAWVAMMNKKPEPAEE